MRVKTTNNKNLIISLEFITKVTEPEKLHEDYIMTVSLVNDDLLLKYEIKELAYKDFELISQYIENKNKIYLNQIHS